MEKLELLQHIQNLSAQHLVTQEEVVAAYNQGAGIATPNVKPVGVQPHKADPVLTKHLSIGDIFLYLGAGIVFIGIAVMIGGSWDNLSPLTRILATLGSAVAAYLAAVLFDQNEKYAGVSQAFFFISGLVMPVGLFVVFDNALSGYSSGTASLVSFILLLVYGLSGLVFRNKIVFTIFTIIFGTWFFFALTEQLTGGNPSFGGTFYLYRILVVGLSYMLLGYSFSHTEQRESLSGWLYGFGAFGFMGAALALGGWSPEPNLFWELIYPGLAFGMIFLSVQLKSKPFLIWGSIFLMAYILKITGEYFSDGLGWPLALVLAGLLLIGVGYYTVNLNKKYLQTA